MTEQEAIEVLRDQQLWKRVVDTLDPRYMNKLSGAVCVAIAALESPRPDWTPCAEGLPEIDQWCDDGFRKTYRVTVEADVGKLFAVLGSPYRYVTTASFELGEWVLDSEDDEFDESEKVIAWMDHPEPYNPDRKEDYMESKLMNTNEPTTALAEYLRTIVRNGGDITSLGRAGLILDAADRLESQERTIAELTARAEQAEAREKAAIDLTAINIMRHIVKEDVDITKWNEPCVLCEHDYSDHGKCGSCDYDKNFELKYHLRGLPQDGEGK